MSRSKIVFDLFSKLSDKEIERGISIRKNMNLFEEERSNPCGNALLIALHDELYELAILYEECEKDMVMTRMAYE